jgi:hypothetical protein
MDPRSAVCACRWSELLPDLLPALLPPLAGWLAGGLAGWLAGWLACGVAGPQRVRLPELLNHAAVSVMLSHTAVSAPRRRHCRSRHRSCRCCSSRAHRSSALSKLPPLAPRHRSSRCRRRKPHLPELMPSAQPQPGAQPRPSVVLQQIDDWPW